MIYRIMADAVLIVHFAFILFVVAGGLTVLWRRWMAFVHLPAAIWGVFVELTGRACPLTDLENMFRLKAGVAGYSDSFIEHYLVRVIYPEGLTDEVQYLLAALAATVNIAVYFHVIRKFGYAGNT